MLYLSVVINDFDILGPGGGPCEADAPLAVDANAVLAGAIIAERLQAVAWARLQVPQFRGIVQDLQLPLRDVFNVQKAPREIKG